MINAEQVVVAVLAAHGAVSGLLGKIDDAMSDYIDSDDCENEFDGDVYECYQETGRGQAEAQIITEVLESYKPEVSEKVYLDAYHLLEGELGL